jgi:carbonic anhydrase
MRIVIISLIVAGLSLAAILIIDSEEDQVSQEVVPGSGDSQVASQPYAAMPAADEPLRQMEGPAVHAGEDTPLVMTHGITDQPGESAASAQAQREGNDQDAAPHPLHWSYQGEAGPANWGRLSPDYAMCGSGRNQSPINLTGFVEADLPPLIFNYAGMAVELLNNGHTLQANYHPGSSLVVDGRIFQLLQFHFHAPSENLLNGKSYPLEAHFVHADDQGNLAVVAALFRQGEENRGIKHLWEQLPQQVGTSARLSAQVRADDLLPEDRDYYRFNGSLTTPPCSQGVIWLVMKQPLTVSPAQVETFSRLLGGPNNRPVQPLNARVVLQ